MREVDESDGHSADGLLEPPPVGLDATQAPALLEHEPHGALHRAAVEDNALWFGNAFGEARPLPEADLVIVRRFVPASYITTEQRVVLRQLGHPRTGLASFE